MSIETKWDVEIEERIDELNGMKGDTKEYTAAADVLVKLMDRKIEIEKLELSAIQHEQQMKEERKARLVKNIIDTGAIVLPLAVTIWGAKASFKFEEDGTITTAVGRKFMDKLISRK